MFLNLLVRNNQVENSYGERLVSGYLSRHCRKNLRQFTLPMHYKLELSTGIYIKCYKFFPV